MQSLVLGQQHSSALAPRCTQQRKQQQQQQQQPRRHVVAHGILDAYRRDKGLPVPPTPQQQQQQGGAGGTSLLDKASQGLTGLLRPQQQQQQQGTGSSWEQPDGDTPCFVECVSQVNTLDELRAEFDSAGPDALVVVDFYKTACGACKFIQPGFVKLCKAAAKSRDGSEDAPPIVFLKHNVYDDEEEEVTDLAKKFNVRSVPRFIFFKDGAEVDNFATRDKAKVAEAILKHAPAGVELGDWQ